MMDNVFVFLVAKGRRPWFARLQRSEERRLVHPLQQLEEEVVVVE
jgi:hypothetical protein